MEAFIGACFGAVVAGFVAALTTYITVNNSWKADCERIGYHLESSAEHKVYKCELRK